jgi:uncharacterized Zn finger protein
MMAPTAHMVLMASEKHVQVACDLCGADLGQPFLAKFDSYYTRCAKCGFIDSNPHATRLTWKDDSIEVLAQKPRK